MARMEVLGRGTHLEPTLIVPAHLSGGKVSQYRIAAIATFRTRFNRRDWTSRNACS